MHHPETTDNLSEQLALLTRDVANAPDSLAALPRWVQSLVRLSELARSSGNHAAAAVADELAANLPAAQEPAKAAEMIGSGLSRLRLTLEPTRSASYALAQDPELIGDFILESREHLNSIEEKLLGIEKGADRTEAVHAVFRSFHTIKGLAGFLEFAHIQEVAHEVESVLDSVRQGAVELNPPVVDAVLESRDYIAKWLAVLESSDPADVPDELTNTNALILRIQGCATDRPAETSAPATSVPADLLRATQRNNTATVRAVRINTEKLDSLVDMVGEMVIAQSLIRHDPHLAHLENSRLMRNMAHLARITNDVQRTAMSMRMVPVSSLFQKMARLIRDLSRRCGKTILCETVGDDVELDRNIVEELADPMMHMVRNSVDHGVESKAERMAEGKPAAATICLRAFHRAGQVVIEVADDGRGIDCLKVLAKARQRGLVGPNDCLTETETLNLIFQPGFSTAENVSDMSGRGVGMDVVRKQVAKLRGNIDITSVVGQGTTFSLRLPLTLAIIDGLVVGVGEERFIIPLASVRELFRPKPEMISTIENEAEMVCLRDQILPVIRLHQRFDIKPRCTDPAEGVLIVADADGVPFCLMVDEMLGKQEVVIKSLGPLFQGIAGLAGGAILGDGAVGLILDLRSLFQGRKDA